MAVTDPQIEPKPPLWKIVLNVIYSALSALKSMGKFSRSR